MWFKIKLAVAAALLVASFTGGYQVATWQNKANQTNALVDQKKDYEKKLADYNKLMLESEQAKSNIEAKYEILKAASAAATDIPECRIGPDALKLWNKAGN